MPHSLQQLRALIEAHPDRAPGLLRPVESLEAAVASEPELCLNRVRTLFEAVHVSIAPILGVQFAETSDFPARNSRIIKALDFSVPGPGGRQDRQDDREAARLYQWNRIGAGRAQQYSEPTSRRLGGLGNA